jgi:hypothetical protein
MRWASARWRAGRRGRARCPPRRRCGRRPPGRPRARRRRCPAPGPRRPPALAGQRLPRRRRALSAPCAVGRRLPTTATGRRDSSAASPCTYSSSGGSACAAARAGRRASPSVSTWRPAPPSARPACGLPVGVASSGGWHRASAAVGTDHSRSAWPAALRARLAGDRKRASSRRAVSRPTPGVSSSLNQAPNSASHQRRRCGLGARRGVRAG